MPPETIPPTCFTTPDQMQATIERLVVDAEYRRQVGEQIRRFVLEAWTPKSVAAKYLQLLDGRAPESWWNDPHRNLYHLGGGLSGDRIRAIVRAVVARHGEQALLLEHNQALRDMLMAFVRDSRN